LSNNVRHCPTIVIQKGFKKFSDFWQIKTHFKDKNIHHFLTFFILSLWHSPFRVEKSGYKNFFISSAIKQT